MVMAVKDAEEAPRSPCPKLHDHSLPRVTRSKQIRKAHGDDSGWMSSMKSVINLLGFVSSLTPRGSRASEYLALNRNTCINNSLATPRS